MVTDNLRLRADASLNGEVLGIAASSTVVVVTGAKSGGFYPVDWDGLEGWMYADYLSWTDAAITPRETGVGGDAGSGPGSANGQAMVDYAMPYLGYRYVWATHGPNTFDCSGFTYWVTLHVLGQNIGTGTWTQSIAGRPVAYGELQPGDLVFFQNTFTWGLSHAGIYIGNNQFIHAENEQTGVRISSLTSPYYSTRWYGARRVG
jgi:cell wall-associated NlpC family hydrolase